MAQLHKNFTDSQIKEFMEHPTGISSATELLTPSPVMIACLLISTLLTRSISVLNSICQYFGELCLLVSIFTSSPSMLKTAQPSQSTISTSSLRYIRETFSRSNIRPIRKRARAIALKFSMFLVIIANSDTCWSIAILDISNPFVRPKD